MKRNSSIDVVGKWLVRALVCLLSLTVGVAARGQVGAANVSGIVQDPTAALMQIGRASCRERV